MRERGVERIVALRERIKQRRGPVGIELLFRSIGEQRVDLAKAHELAGELARVFVVGVVGVGKDAVPVERG